MPSSRRVKVFAIAAVAIVFTFLYLRSSTPQPSQSRYLKSLIDVSDAERHRQSQQESLVSPADHSQDLTDTAGVSERLKEAEEAAKKAASEKAGPKPVVIPDKLRKHGGEAKKNQVAVENEEYDPLVEVAAYLKRAPIVIFSKSYCPYSQRAKVLLLEKYNIEPAPLVVELDLHEHGAEIQAALGKQTGRRTVPNVMISGKSIGGSDDIYAMESEGTLMDTITSMGGKRVRSVARLQE